MKFIIAVILLCAGTCLSAERPRHRCSRTASSRGGPGSECGGAVAAAAFVLSKDYEYPSASNARLPAITTGCVQCRVGAVTGSATAYECVNDSGTSAGTMTDPGTCVKSASFIPSVKQIDLTAACAPSIVSATLDTLFAGAHTVTLQGYGRASGAPSGFNYYFAKGAGDGYFQIVTSSGFLNFTDYTFSNTQVQTTTNLIDGWGTVVETWNGLTTGSPYTLDARGSSLSFANSQAHTPWSGAVYHFGTRDDGSLEQHGPQTSFTVCPGQASLATRQQTIDRAFGIYNADGRVGGGNSQTQSVDNTASTGNIDNLFSGGALVTSAGLLTSVGHTNKWAANALDLSTDSDVGTPTITANVSSGPFAVQTGGPECDRMTTANAAALDGKQSATLGTAAQAGNASAYVKAGSLTTATIQVVVLGGGGSKSCPFTGLTSTARRLECRFVATGAGITSIKVRYLNGINVGDVGTTEVCHRQLTATINLEPAAIDNTLHGNTFYTLAPTTDGWPDPVTGGAYEVVHTPLFDPSADWVGTGAGQGTYYLFDADIIGVDHTVATIFGYTAPGRMLAVFRDGLGGSSDITIDGVSLTAGTSYVTRQAWRPLGASKCNLYVYHDTCGSPTTCHATTLIGSDTTGTAVCPGIPNRATLANRGDNTAPGSIVLNAVRVYSL